MRGKGEGTGGSCVAGWMSRENCGKNDVEERFAFSPSEVGEGGGGGSRLIKADPDRWEDMPALFASLLA